MMGSSTDSVFTLSEVKSLYCRDRFGEPVILYSNSVGSILSSVPPWYTTSQLKYFYPRVMP
jgi:hypothetical protein